MKRTLYLTAWKDRHMLLAGFKAGLRPNAFRKDGFAESREAEVAELEVRLSLVLALLDSLGIEAHFAAEPGDASGKEPEDGYEEVEVSA